MNRTQKKTLVLLLGILVGLGILLAVVSAVKRSSAQREAEEAAAQDAASVITETEAAYSSLTYDNGSATLSFHLDEAGKWVWSDDPEFPLDDSTIQSILTLLTNLKPQQTITEGDTLEAYGLDQPFATLTAAKPDGGTLTISLGNTTTDGNSYYMLMNEQESPVYIISNSLYTEMSKTIYDMCDLPDLPQLTEENLQSVTVEGAASTLLRPIDKETSTDEETGETTETDTLGVYVVTAGRAEFKPVTILTEGDDFYVVQSVREDKKALRAGDEVIVQATGLYDGQLLLY